MPASNLKINHTRDIIETWLKNNYSNKDCFIPNKSNLKNYIKSNQFLYNKGLYFWFLNESGFDKFNKLSKIENFNIQFNKISGAKIQYGGKIYKLVYIGQAGAAHRIKPNAGTLFSRFNTGHLANSVKTEPSTFRNTLATIISDVTLGKNIEDEINGIMDKYFLVKFIDFIGDYHQVNDDILKHEKILINEFRPIFNLDHNPNKLILRHPTNLIEKRKREVNSVDIKIKEKTLNKKNTIRNSRNLIKFCEFNFLGDHYKLVHDIKYNLYKNKELVNRGVKTIVRDFIVNNQLPITLISNSGNDKKNTNQLAGDLLNYLGSSIKRDSNTTINLNIQLDLSDLNKSRTLIIINCTANKNKGGSDNHFFDFFDNDKDIISLRSKIDKLFPLDKKNTLLMPAIKRYSGHWVNKFHELNLLNKLNDLNKKKKLYFIIISAKYGVIDFFKTIPMYDLKIDKTGILFGTTIEKSVNQYIKKYKINKVFNFCSKEYNSSAFPNLNSKWISPNRKRGQSQHYVGNWISDVITSIED
jgi:hypothetical protein